MNGSEFLGMLIVALVSVGGFAGLLLKCFKPISDLNMNIVRLTDAIDQLNRNYDKHERRLNSHSRELDELAGILSKHSQELGRHDERLKALECKE